MKAGKVLVKLNLSVVCSVAASLGGELDVQTDAVRPVSEGFHIRFPRRFLRPEHTGSSS